MRIKFSQVECNERWGLELDFHWRSYRTWHANQSGSEWHKECDWEISGIRLSFLATIEANFSAKRRERERERERKSFCLLQVQVAVFWLLLAVVTCTKQRESTAWIQQQRQEKGKKYGSMSSFLSFFIFISCYIEPVYQSTWPRDNTHTRLIASVTELH